MKQESVSGCSSFTLQTVTDVYRVLGALLDTKDERPVLAPSSGSWIIQENTFTVVWQVLVFEPEHAAAGLYGIPK